MKLICDPLSFVNAPLLVVRNGSASLVEILTVVDDAVELDTTMNGVPPTSLPKSRTMAAGDPHGDVRAAARETLARFFDEPASAAGEAARCPN